MTDILKIYKTVLLECDGGMAAGDGGAACGGGEGVSGDVAGAVADTVGSVASTDILGDCDHQHDGYMSKDCFHIPAYALSTPFYRDGSKRKKNKNGKKKKYYAEKGMKIIKSYDDLVSETDDNKEK